MGLLEKLQPSVGSVADTPPDQFQLQLCGQVRTAVEDGDLPQGNPGALQFLDPLPHEPGLLERAAQPHHPGLLPGTPAGIQLLGQLAAVERDRAVGQGHYLRRAPVVLLHADHQAAGIFFGERKNILYLGKTKSVDGLGIVADHADGALPGKEIHNPALDQVGILEFVHQNVLEAAAVALPNGRLPGEKLQPAQEQIVEIKSVGRLLAGLVLLIELPDQAGILPVLGIELLQDIFDGEICIAAMADYRGQKAALD